MAAAAAAWSAHLHPVLQRAYAARGVRSALELDHLARAAAAGRHARRHRRRRSSLLLAHRDGGRVLVIGDFDADGATSTALMVRALARVGLRCGRFSGAEPFRVRLRPDTRDRRARAHARADADRDRRQRHFEPRRSRRGARLGHRSADHGSSSAGRRAAGCRT